MSLEHLTADVTHPRELAAADAAAWRACQDATPAFQSPILGPDFAQAVGAYRSDARVAVFRDAGRPVGFLAYHQRPGGLARPIGAPFSDYHGLVTTVGAGLTAGRALSTAGIAAYRFNGLIDPDAAFATASTREAYSIALGDGSADEYLESLRAASPKRFKNMRRLESKLDREVGPLRLVAEDADQTAFDRIVSWKRDQFRRTGMHDVLGPDWVQGLVGDLFARREGDFRGLMVSLYAGERLVAGHFGVRQGGVYHPWLASADPELAVYSPGQTFLMQAIRAMPQMGLTVYDLGPGHDHYKRPFVREPLLIGEGLAVADSAAGRMATLRDRAWGLAGPAQPLVGRLQRRLDQIASVELTAMGRVRGLAGAVAGLGARSQSLAHAATD